jgi:hypothetical protein
MLGEGHGRPLEDKSLLGPAVGADVPISVLVAVVHVFHPCRMASWSSYGVVSCPFIIRY